MVPIQYKLFLGNGHVEDFTVCRAEGWWMCLLWLGAS